MTYMPFFVNVRTSGENILIDMTEEGTWTGDIEGDSIDDPCRVIIFKAEGEFPFITDWKFRWYTGLATFEECTVDGKTGGLVMRLVGKDDGPGTDWFGTWVIIKGTGELAGIHGQGNFWGPGWLGTSDPGIIPYDGWVHFDPS